MYATDFHNGRVAVYDSHWRRIRRAGAFADPAIPDWYAPFGIQAVGRSRLRLVRLARAGQRQRRTDRRLRRRVRPRRPPRRARRAPRRANAPWGMARRAARRSAASAARCSSATSATAASTPTGDVERELAARSARCDDAHGKPLVINGLWGIAFGNGGMSGKPRRAVLHLGPARVARRDRARRARPARLDLGRLSETPQPGSQ